MIQNRWLSVRNLLFVREQWLLSVNNILNSLSLWDGNYYSYFLNEWILIWFDKCLGSYFVIRFLLFTRNLRTFFNFVCNSKLAFPPWTVISSFGSSRFHSRVKSWTNSSGLVSYARRTYCEKSKFLINTRWKVMIR